MRRALTFVLVAAVGAALAVSSAGATGPGTKPQAQPEPTAKTVHSLQCQTYGSTEFVNDVNIWNTGSTAVPNGTRISWDVMNGTWTGTHTLPSNLAPGGHVILKSVVNGAQSQGTCTVKVVEGMERMQARLSHALRRPDLTCAIEVYDLDHGDVPVQPGSTTAQALNFRVEISATLRGAVPASNVTLTYNWALGSQWKRPLMNPWSHVFATIANGTTVDAPDMTIDATGGTTSMPVKITATVDADKTVGERNEGNNGCSFEFTRAFAY